jgi:zinc ribbon protein
MASSGPRFCPRCGTARVSDMAFCPNCGLDLREVPRDDPAGGPAAVTSRETVPEPPSVPSDTPPEPPFARDRGEPIREGTLLGRLFLPGLLVLLVLLAGAWVLRWGPFAPAGGDTGPFAAPPAGTATPSSPFLPAVTAQPSSSLPAGFTAPPVGLTILSPADGSVVGAKNVTVIGTAPPGLRITQDISLGLDRHATADGTGHWAIEAELAEGQNDLKFRIGDDPSTTQSIRVIYLPPAS